MRIERFSSRRVQFMCGASALVIVLSTAPCALAQSKPSPDRTREIDRMIDAMASRNKAPKLVEVPGHGYGQPEPLVSRDYNWSEQARVEKAIDAVRADKSDEMWWRLYEHFGDKRYVMSLVFDDFRDSRNIDVGTVCFEIVVPTLEAAYVRHFPKVSGAMPYTFHPSSVLSEKNVQKWRGRPLYEIQIEVCEEAIKQMDSLKATNPIGENDYRREEAAHEFTKEEKAKFAKAVKKQIEELKRTKRAVWPEGPTNIYELPWEPLTAKEAAEVREAYDEAKNEHSKSGKGK